MNPDISFVNLLAVVAIAFAVPFALALSPARRVPATVFLVLAGTLAGPSGLGLVAVDLPVQIMALLGLAFLLFLAGTEIEIAELRGQRLWVAVVAFATSFAIAVVAGFAVAAAGLTGSPLLIAVLLVGTSLGVVIPALKDAGEAGSPFGQLVIAGASVADFGAIILLSILFARDGTEPGATVLLVALLLALGVAVVVAAGRAERSRRLGDVLQRLEDTTAQIRVRAALVLLVGFAALAEALGLEVILGAFIAGAILRVVDAGGAMQHPQFRSKLEGIGYGVFVPVFFVTTGLRLDLGALAAGPEVLFQVPLFLGLLLIVRGVPTVLLVGRVSPGRLVGGGLLEATLLPVAPVQIGLELGLLSPGTGAALLIAGLVAVLVFPVLALALLGRASDAKPLPNLPVTMERPA